MVTLLSNINNPSISKIMLFHFMASHIMHYVTRVFFVLLGFLVLVVNQSAAFGLLCGSKSVLI